MRFPALFAIGCALALLPLPSAAEDATTTADAASPAATSTDTGIPPVEGATSTTPDDATPAPPPEPVPAQVDIPANMAITDAVSWSPSHGPYVLAGDIYIKDGGSLIIAPGTTVKLAKSARIALINGTLVVGVAGDPRETLFTSIADGTSDADANRWLGIYVFGGSATIEHARFSYTGGPATQALCGDTQTAPSITTCYDTARTRGTIFVSSGTAIVRDSTFDWTGQAHIFAVTGSLLFERDRFADAARILTTWEDTSAGPPTITIHDSSIGTAVAYVTHKHAVLHLESDWWGSPAGPSNDWYGQGYDPFEDVSSDRYVEPWLTRDPFNTAPNPCSSRCASNVLFLPGMEGSRLYDDAEKLWEPFDRGDNVIGLVSGIGDRRVSALGLDEQGASTRGDIYARDGDVIRTAAGTDYYETFAEKMDGLQHTGLINAWKPIAYDWRLSPSTIVQSGTVSADRISYGSPSSVPYIENGLRTLAASSKTGKVTIVAHSYGGLVAKALMQQLGDAETARLIDKVILVGVPQTGTPEAVGGLLFGYRQGITTLDGLFPIVSTHAARALADHAPAAYAMLPSAAYFNSVNDPHFPVVSFGGNSYTLQRALYGSFIHDAPTLRAFLASGTEPLPAGLLASANGEHATLDAWMPPAGVSLYQVAGWGEDTVAGIQFYDEPLLGGLFGSKPSYRPLFTEDGDSVVTVPSALYLGTGARYWFDFPVYEAATHHTGAHESEFATPPLVDFIASLIDGSDASSPYVSTTEPAAIDGRKRLHFVLHGSSGLTIRDGNGNETSADGTTNGITDSSSGTVGDESYVSVPDGEYQALIAASAQGLALDIIQDDGSAQTIDVPPSDAPTTIDTGESGLPSDSSGQSMPTSSSSDDVTITVWHNPNPGHKLTVAKPVKQVVSKPPKTTEVASPTASSPIPPATSSTKVKAPTKAQETALAAAAAYAADSAQASYEALASAVRTLLDTIVAFLIELLRAL